MIFAILMEFKENSLSKEQDNSIGVLCVDEQEQVKELYKLFHTSLIYKRKGKMAQSKKKK